MTTTNQTPKAPAIPQKLPQLRIAQSQLLPDLGLWTNRFNIPSSSSNRIYTIAQHKDRLHWGCSCPGWRAHRHCKHLDALGLPGHEIPHAVNLIKR